jgi:hypothetical protein
MLNCACHFFERNLTTHFHYSTSSTMLFTYFGAIKDFFSVVHQQHFGLIENGIIFKDSTNKYLRNQILIYILYQGVYYTLFNLRGICKVPYVLYFLRRALKILLHLYNILYYTFATLSLKSGSRIIPDPDAASC